jgi:hypothetical protein
MALMIYGSSGFTIYGSSGFTKEYLLFISLICSRNILGMHMIEFQKLRLALAHVLLWLGPQDKSTYVD